MGVTIRREGHLVIWSPRELPPPAEAAEALEGHRWERARVVLLDLTGTAETSRRWEERALVWLARFPLPVVAALSGSLGSGWSELAAMADVRVAAPGAEAAFPGDPPPAVAERLRTLFGGAWPARAGAAELFARGVVTALDDDPLGEARRLAGVIASRGPYAVQLAKEAIWRGLRMPLEQALRFETDLTLLLQTTKDRAEGVRAFLEKRTPNFEGA